MPNISWFCGFWGLLQEVVLLDKVVVLSIFISRYRNMYIHWDNICKLKLRAVTAVNITDTYFSVYYGIQKLSKYSISRLLFFNPISLCSHLTLIWFCWCLFLTFYEWMNLVYCFCDKVNLFFVDIPPKFELDGIVEKPISHHVFYLRFVLFFIP